MGDIFKREFSLGQVDTGRPYKGGDLGYGQGTSTRLDPNAPPVPDIITAPGQSVPGMPAYKTTVTRPTFLTSFLQNLGPSLSGAMSAPRGSGLAGGIGGGLKGIEEAADKQIAERRQRQQMDLQEQSLQLRQQQEQMQAEQQAQMGPLQVEHQKLQNAILKSQADFSTNPDKVNSAMDTMFSSLGKLSSDEQALKDSAKMALKQTGSLNVGEQNVQRIFAQRQISGRQNQAPATQAFMAYQALASGKTPPTLHGDPKDIISAFKSLQKDMALPRIDMMLARGDIMPIPIIDDQGNQTFLSANELLGNKPIKTTAKPNVAPLAAGTKTMQSQRLLGTVGGAIDNFEKNVPNLAKMTEGDKILINKALNEHGEGTWDFLKASGAVNQMSEAGKQYVADATRVSENLPSLRGTLGQGQASDARINKIIGAMSGALMSLDPGLVKLQIKNMREEIGLAKKMFPKDITAKKDEPIKITLPSGKSIEIP